MLKVVVYNNVFSDQWMRKESTGDGGNFLKEVVLQCEVNHWESF